MDLSQELSILVLLNIMTLPSFNVLQNTTSTNLKANVRSTEKGEECLRRKKLVQMMEKAKDNTNHGTAATPCSQRIIMTAGPPRLTKRVQASGLMMPS